MKQLLKNFSRIAVIVYAGWAWASPSPDGESLYQLNLNLTDQAGAAIGLDVYRGHPVLIGMFYAHCPYVCPLTINTLQTTESKLDPQQRRQLRVLLVSLDSENDTAETLAAAADKQHVDTSRWKLARADAADVRKLAAVLGIRFKKLPDGEFNHSTVITLLDTNGVPVTRSNQPASADPALIAAIQALKP